MFHTEYGVKPPLRNTIICLVEKFNSERIVQSTTMRVKPQLTPQTINRASSYFKSHPKISIRRAVRDIPISLFNNSQKFPKKSNSGVPVQDD